MNAMTLISRRTASVRCEDFGRDKTYRQTVAQWTDYERRCNRIIEDLMIREADRLRGSFPDQPIGRSDISQETARGNILAALDVPRSGKEIAEIVGRSGESVLHSLRKMEADGYVAHKLQPRIQGRNQPRIWFATGKRLPSVNENRARVLKLMTEPMTISQIAEKSGVSLDGVRKMMRQMGDDGIVRTDGEVLTTKNQMATLWVRA